MAIPNVPSSPGNQTNLNPAPTPSMDPNPMPSTNTDVNRMVPEAAAPTTPNVNPPSPSVPGTNDTMTEMDNASLSTAQSVAPEPPPIMPEPMKMNSAPVEPTIEMNTLPPLSTPTEVTEPGMPEEPASPADDMSMANEKPAVEEKHETIAHAGILDTFSSPADATAENPSPEAPTPAPVEPPAETASGASKILPFVVLIAAFIALLTLIYYFFL